VSECMNEGRTDGKGKQMVERQCTDISCWGETKQGIGNYVK